MNIWVQELKQLARELFARETAGETAALVTLCLLLCLFVYHRMAAGFRGGGRRSLLPLTLGVLVMMIAAAAMRMFYHAGWPLQAAAALAALLGIAVPLTMIVEKASYAGALLVWGLVLGMLALILWLQPLVSDWITQWMQQSDRLHRQREIRMFGG